MNKDCLRNDLDPFNALEVIKFRREEKKLHPHYMRTFGTICFCGGQGYGKTISVTQYVKKLMNTYKYAILVSNVELRDFPFNATYRRFGERTDILYHGQQKVDLNWLQSHDERICIEYDGLDTLKYIENDEYGVIYLIDEIHLELNSLESKNVDIDIMTEISQQRKQRKHIVGTSQIFKRMAKPLREQIHDFVICRCFFGFIQYNKWADQEHISETDKGIEINAQGRFLWFHSVDMYKQYNTYAKMKRYSNEWNGRKRIDY